MKSLTPYETLVNLSKQLVGIKQLIGIQEAGHAKTLRLIQRNESTLESIRKVLDQKCAVPVRYSNDFFSEHCNNFSYLRSLTYAFRAEALLAMSRRDYWSAIRTCIDILSLANAVRRGGLLTDLLVSLSIADISMELLRKQRLHYHYDIRQEMVEMLCQLECEREPFAEIVLRDRGWETLVKQIQETPDFLSCKLSSPEECKLSEADQKRISQWMQEFANQPISELRKLQRDQDARSLATMRMLAIEFALSNYKETFGRFPEELSALLPMFLPNLLLDPFTGDEFVYRLYGNAAYLLYSPGPKLFDGGGHFGPWVSVAGGGADFCLDANDY